MKAASFSVGGPSSEVKATDVVVARRVSLFRFGCRQQFWALLRRGRITGEADQVARYICLFAVFGGEGV